MQDATIAYDRFDPASEGLREALTSTGNGYFCTRCRCPAKVTREIGRQRLSAAS